MMAIPLQIPLVLIYTYVMTVQGQMIGLCNGGQFVKHSVHWTSSKFDDQSKAVYTNVRSVLECATLCHSNSTCQTAVYENYHRCLLLSRPKSSITGVTTGSGSSRLMDFSFAGSANQIAASASLCPSTCSGTTICVLDCSLSSSGGQIPGCMELSTAQYESGCAFDPQVRAVEYYLKNLNVETNTNNLVIFTIPFQKEFDETALRVRFRGTLQGAYGWSGGWGKWHIYFNGSACATPGAIESANYNGNSDVRHYKAAGIHGICYNIGKGLVNVDLRTQTSSAYMHVGKWTSGSRFYIDEMPLSTYASEPATVSCPGLSFFNTRELYTPTEYGDDPNTHLWNLAFTKVEDGTTLRINLDVAIRVYVHSNTDSCAAWYVRIDGVDCSPVTIAKVIGNHNTPQEIYDEHKNVEIEGYCRGITKGSHNLQLHVYTCPFNAAYSSYDSCTGWNSLTRGIIQEFREASNVMAAVSSNGILYRIPQFNSFITGQSNPSRGEDSGIIWTLTTFNKLYTESGIMVSMSADGRAYHGGSAGYSQCCRFYFTFNGADCTSPGPIEGVSALNKISNIHRPMYIEGICRGISAGNVKVELQVGACIGESGSRDCYFGWTSYTHAMVSETFYEHETITF